MSFAESYLGKLRFLVGSQLLLVPGARIVIEAPDGKILLEQRADLGLWGVPGGSAEPGESLSDTIVREVREETGLTLGRVTAFGFASDPAVESIAFPNGDACQYFSLLYTSGDFQGEPRPLDGESLAMGWFDPAALPEMVPNMRRTVGAWLEFRRSGEFQLI